ncbi:hypothetical protein MSG28_010047 [Choristoneura fumiferana]|uniref:Uncharacterized protein n=1 Tax=Choristoneura fumiferana TaxID=7141 RepID=A0ACC0KJG2_CHOFU|nr:hypothetical protein MSG28_010047 [Choristoneura fumiferana]
MATAKIAAKIRPNSGASFMPMSLYRVEAGVEVEVEVSVILIGVGTSSFDTTGACFVTFTPEPQPVPQPAPPARCLHPQHERLPIRPYLIYFRSNTTNHQLN